MQNNTVNHKIIQLVQLLNEKLKLFFSISFGIFLFVLFFEPFPLEHFDFNNRLLFIAGMAVIVFLFVFLVRAEYPWLVQKNLENENNPVIASYLSGAMILICSSVAFIFYLRFVGLVPITFFIAIKVILICAFPPVALRLYDTNQELRQQNELLVIEKKIIQKQVKKYEDDLQNKSIEFISETRSENLTLPIHEIALVKSADNYVEIVYLEGDHYKKRLLRNTMKNIESLLKPYPNLIRCHRTSIINVQHIEKLHTNYNNHWLTIMGYPEQIPVSRQYLLKLKEGI